MQRERTSPGMFFVFRVNYHELPKKLQHNNSDQKKAIEDGLGRSERGKKPCPETEQKDAESMNQTKRDSPMIDVYFCEISQEKLQTTPILPEYVRKYEYICHERLY